MWFHFFLCICSEKLGYLDGLKIILNLNNWHTWGQIKVILAGSVEDPQNFAIADPCPYDVKYSPDVLQKKTKVIDTYNTDKNCFHSFLCRIKPWGDIDKDPQKKGSACGS